MRNITLQDELKILKKSNREGSQKCTNSHSASEEGGKTKKKTYTDTRRMGS